MLPGLGALLLVWVVFRLCYRARARRLEGEELIRSYVIPSSALSGLTRHHPHLDGKDQLQVAAALRDFFLVRLRVGDRLIGMPSKVVDDLWHEFILDTREYERFCKAAFGSFFHHVPAAATPPGEEMGAALRRTWRSVCFAEGIDPRRPTRLPLLFRTDSELQIAGGHSYINYLFAPPRMQPAGGDGTGCAGGDSHGSCCSGHGGCGGGCGGH